MVGWEDRVVKECLDRRIGLLRKVGWEDRLVKESLVGRTGLSRNFLQCG